MSDALAKRREAVASENLATLSRLTDAVTPLFTRVPEVVGDDDRVIVTLTYEEFEHLAWVMEPLLAGGPEKYAAYKIWPGIGPGTP